jgi:hypothetical protein
MWLWDQAGSQSFKFDASEFPIENGLFKRYVLLASEGQWRRLLHPPKIIHVAVLVLVFLRYCICSIWYCSTSCYKNRCKHRAGQSPAQQESFLFNFRSIEVDVDFAVEGLVPKSEDGFIERRRVPYPLVLVPRQNI